MIILPTNKCWPRNDIFERKYDMKKIVLPIATSLTLGIGMLGTTAVFATNTTPDPASPDPASAETPVTAELTLPNPDPIVPPFIDPTDPNVPGGDTDTGITGHFGIAYAPTLLSVQQELNAKGQQIIPLDNGKGVTKFNVGVRDTLRKQQDWKLSAQLTWDGNSASSMVGSKITGTNGQVMENIDGYLKGLKDNEVTTTAANLEISNTPVDILETVPSKTTNAVYNYGFETPELVIPEVSKVPAGTYSGKITWNLAVTPNP